MARGEESQANIHIDGMQLEQVKSLKYFEVEIRNRIGWRDGVCNKVYHIINQPFISKTEITTTE